MVVLTVKAWEMDREQREAAQANHCTTCKLDVDECPRPAESGCETKWHEVRYGLQEAEIKALMWVRMCIEISMRDGPWEPKTDLEKAVHEYWMAYNEHYDWVWK